MTDIFREVEEEVRRERLERLWQRYGDYVIAAVAVIIIAIAGYELWQRYEQSQREKASVAFSTAMNDIAANPGAAAGSFEKLSATAPKGYAQLSRLAEADAVLASGKRTQAIALYESLAAQDSGPLGNAARIRAAWAMVDFASRPELQTLLAPLTSSTSAWRQMAREVFAYYAYRTGQANDAETEYAKLASDPEAPQPLRQRARAMAGLLKAGGDANFGFVPSLQKPSSSSNAAPSAAAPSSAAPTGQNQQGPASQ